MKSWDLGLSFLLTWYVRWWGVVVDYSVGWWSHSEGLGILLGASWLRLGRGHPFPWHLQGDHCKSPRWFDHQLEVWLVPGLKRTGLKSLVLWFGGHHRVDSLDYKWHHWIEGPQLKAYEFGRERPGKAGRTPCSFLGPSQGLILDVKAHNLAAKAWLA